MTIKKIKSPITWDLMILSIRLLLAFIFLSYGIGKLSGGQFGNLTDKELSTPIKELTLFKVGWYLFDHQPFKYFIGISQIIAAVLILYRKTIIIGILMLIPIVANILIIDLTIMPYGFKVAFFFRLTGYLFYMCLILYYYRRDLIPVWRVITTIKTLKLNHKYLNYLWIIPIMIILECIPIIPKYLFLIIKHFDKFYEQIKSLF